jgi:predicted MFS family arabinose efflux permease
MNNFKIRKTIAAILGCGVVAVFIFLVLPLYVGLMADGFGFSEGQLGILASMDLAGIALMSLSGPLWINRLNWRKVMRYSLLWLIAWNLVSIELTGFGALCTARFLAGLGGGLMAVMVIRSISYMSDPDRIMAIFVVLQVVLQVMGFMLLPSLILAFGVAGFFGALVCLCVAALFLSRNFPTAGLEEAIDKHVDGGTAPGHANLRPVLVLIGLVLFFIAQVSLFSFIERLGVDSGFGAQEIGNALTVAVLIGLAGAVLGAVMSVRFGRLLPIAISGVAQLVCYYLLTNPIDLLAYTLIVGGIQFFWNLPLGYQVGTLISEDPHHRFVLLIPFVQALGISIGPFLGGFAMEYASYPGLVTLASVALVIYVLLLAPMARSQDRKGYA